MNDQTIDPGGDLAADPAFGDQPPTIPSGLVELLELAEARRAEVLEVAGAAVIHPAECARVIA